MSQTDQTDPKHSNSPPRPADLDARREALEAALSDRILVLDGATGTALQDAELTADDFGGPELEGCNENLVLTRPDVVTRVHEGYLAAGADIVETNTFGATPLVLDEYDLGEHAYEINRRAAELARQACAKHATPERPRFVCGSLGPTTKAISVTGGVTFDELIDNFRVQALGLMAGGADYLLLETAQDTRNVKAGLLGLEQAFDQAGWRLPVAVSATIEPTGTMLAGQDAEALAVSLAHADLLYLGLNCATGPDLMTDHVRTLAELAKTRVACVPNAGLPDENGLYTQGPEAVAAALGRFMDHGWLNLAGGCCGTTAEHVSAIAREAEGREPREIPSHSRAFVSGIEAVELHDDNRPLFVGERTNVLGSRAFKKLVQDGDFEAAAEVGRAQVKASAQVIDVCLQDPDRDETADMERFLAVATRLIKAPLMIDSTDPEVMERSLVWCQGKAVLNSVNLEDGLDRFERVVPLAKKFGAALVVGLIDEEGMAVSVDRKMEVAHRSVEILQGMGMAPEDLWIDALVFPCGTGDETYLGSAGATIEAVRRIDRELPRCRTILGVSNVSFGLPTAGREVLNSVFLYHATKAGLDAAIVNTQRLARYAEIPEAERRLAEALLDLEPGDAAAGERAVEEFTEHFRGLDGSVRSSGPDRSELPLDQRLARAVVEGSKVGLDDDIDAALDDDRWPEPLDIINGPLMEGMAEVGRLFNDNQLIVAEVLQSAEVMKAAVARLEPHMERAEGETSGPRYRGKVLLATVKGDVHDIGKNLVDIILSNNGFEVINLGIKVPPEQLVQGWREHRPDVIGLSGLLVKSAQQMIATAEDLAANDISTPLVVGGAALTRRFTHTRIAPAYRAAGGTATYAADAMSGLALVESLCDAERRPRVLEEIGAAIEADVDKVSTPRPAPEPGPAVAPGPSPTVSRDVEVPSPPDTDRHAVELPLAEVWDLVNPQMLYGKHLGLKGSVAKLDAAGDDKLARLRETISELQDDAVRSGATARAVWRFFPARVDADDPDRLLLLDPEVPERVAAAWTFPRQQTGDRLALPDYVIGGDGETDHVALFVTTFGPDTRQKVEAWKDAGEYLKAHAYAALALESAEGAAEWVHRHLRAAWGFPDPADLEPRRLFSGRYRGKRYSFGYPACPDLEGQRALFAALRPEEIGVELTDGDMMEPEASVSALVFHHPEARYFGV